MDNNMKFCKFCGEKIDEDAIVCPKCGRQLKMLSRKIETIEGEQAIKNNNTKFYTKLWFMWLMLFIFAPIGIFLMWKFHDGMKKKTKIIITVVFAIIFFLIMVGNTSNSDEITPITNDELISQESSSSRVTKNKVVVIDFSLMGQEEIINWCNENNLICNIAEEYSDTISKGEFIKQSIVPNDEVREGSKITITFSLGKEPTTEQKNALKKAEDYAKIMHMSKQAIYEQLISEYGEKFDEEAARYAIETIEWDWNENALITAKTYRDMLNMSKSAIYDQLVSEYGEQFTKEEAQYAIDHLDD